jgi:hypothetical protein
VTPGLDSFFGGIGVFIVLGFRGIFVGFSWDFRGIFVGFSWDFRNFLKTVEQLS